MRSLRAYLATLASRKFAARGALAAGLAVAACAFALLVFPSASFDSYVRNRITSAIEDAYPEYAVRIDGLRYAFFANRLECAAITIVKADSTMTCSVASVSVTGIARLQILLHGAVVPARIAQTRVDARGIVLTLNRVQYAFRCARMELSGRDSTLVADSLECGPSQGDERFFSRFPFRRTRFHLAVPVCRVSGLDVLALLEGTAVRARAADAPRASLSILIDKDKPVNDDAPRPLMPAALLSLVNRPLSVDSIRVTNGAVTYCERHPENPAPALLAFDSVQVTLEELRNAAGGGDSALLSAQGVLMGEGAMALRMSLPVAAPELSYRFSGSLSRMPLRALNPFIEVSDHVRIKSGVLHEATFEVAVDAGRATGSARAAYEDLKIVAIDGRTGSESGIGNTVVSFLANNVKLRTSNMPGPSVKTGTVNYAKHDDEEFVEFSWCALRSGVKDIVGF